MAFPTAVNSQITDAVVQPSGKKTRKSSKAKKAAEARKTTKARKAAKTKKAKLKSRKSK